jgi:hypothetical protein
VNGADAGAAGRAAGPRQRCSYSYTSCRHIHEQVASTEQAALTRRLRLRGESWPTSRCSRPRSYGMARALIAPGGSITRRLPRRGVHSLRAGGLLLPRHDARRPALRHGPRAWTAAASCYRGRDRGVLPRGRTPRAYAEVAPMRRAAWLLCGLALTGGCGWSRGRRGCRWRRLPVPR